jgi:hypothetical protein
MFRVGFGDFFLLTVPTAKGDKHILIDCGVHAQDLGSIKDAVDQMASDCGKDLALVIMTHRHADHISGFATCSDVFSQITVERVWMPWFEKLISQLTNVAEQYLTDAMQEDDEPAKSFPNAFRAKTYPPHAFKVFAADKVKAMIDGMRPDVLAARAQAADKTLNNQSLVILFSFAGKNLLFAGDAQWGNWENFLYGGAFGTPGHTDMTKQATDILNNIDFYKVGHHGSRNATPKDAVAAMRLGCVGMCSTQLHAYNEVPREPLLKALRGRMQDQLARSDQIAANGVPAEPEAGQLPGKFDGSNGKLFIDYNF